jgi:predicted PurR-regulated permease PerM
MVDMRYPGDHRWAPAAPSPPAPPSDDDTPGTQAAAGDRRADAPKRSLRELAHRQGWISGGVLTLIAVYILWFAKALLLPIFLALLFSVLLRPLVRGLKQLMVPETLGAAIVVVLALVLAGSAMVQVAAPAGDWVARAPYLRAELKSKISTLRAPLDKAQQVADTVEEVAAGGESEKPSVVVEGPGLLQQLFVGARTALVIVVVVVVLVYFLLARGSRTAERVLATLRDPEQRVIWAGVLEDIQAHMARYLLILAGINCVLGSLTAVAMWALGMPNPLLWGVLAGLLNFIPYAGALITLVVIGMVSILTFDQWLAIALPPMVFALLTGLEGQVVTPLIIGRRLTLNPVAVFVSILFWGWLWGLAGMLLAVPILASAKIALTAAQSHHPLAALIGDEPLEPEPDHVGD